MFKSYAEWPADVYTASDGTHVSSDTHRSEAEAAGVCRLLERHGFGGRGPKPVRTWVESLNEKSTKG